MVDHEVGEPASINQNNSFHGICKLYGLRSICRCGYENSLVCTTPSESTIKCLYFRPTDWLLPTFCLNINFLQTKLVQRNDSVDPSIAGPAYPLQISATGPIPHPVKEVQYDGFKEAG